VVTQKDQIVTGEKAVFDTSTNLIAMLSGVVLTQCNNVLRGDRLLVDMTTGVSRIEVDHGKVQGLLDQSAQGYGSAGPTATATRCNAWPRAARSYASAFSANPTAHSARA
jgi:lipopolysaccharide export system protein LptA